MGWYEDYRAVGIECLVIKAAAGRYPPGPGDWIRVRNRQTRERSLTCSRSWLMALLYLTAAPPQPGRLGAMAWNRSLRSDLSSYAVTGRDPA
jgi:hypothetical protein